MDQSYHQPTHMPAMLRKLTLITVMLVAILLLAKLLQAVAFAAPLPQHPSTVAAACQELVSNGDFEAGGTGWTLTTTPATATIVNEPVHGGNSAVRLGIAAGGANVVAYSTAYQRMTIPAGTQKATLIFWEWLGSSDSGDLRQITAYNATLTTVLLAINSTTGNGNNTWVQRTFDVTSLAGQSIVLYLNVYNNGTGSTLAAYIDEISLQVCDDTTAPTATPTNTPVAPTPTVTPTPSTTPAPVRVRAGSGQAINGAKSVTVPLDLVVLTDQVNVGAINLDLDYNAALLKVTDCAVGEALDLLLCNSATPGHIRLAGVSAAGIRNEVNLAHLTFEFLQLAESTVPLTIQLKVVGNVDGAAVGAIGQNGTVTLICPPDTEDCTAGIQIYLPLINR
ncbi:MAG: hypothetical protein R2932_07940 [Caldilineaceae bacterium]